jgi:hypothetical protein
MRRHMSSSGALIFGALLPAFAFSQAPAPGASGPRTAADPCPGGTAFIAKEKALEAAKHPRAQLPPTQPGLSTELKEMAARDQKARMAWIGNPTDAAKKAAVTSIDAVNLARLKPIIAKFGFPTLAMVGREGVQAAWLLIQHADSDVAFQKHALALIEAAASDEVRPGDIAMLSDRIRIHEGKPQRYGSNFDLRTMQPTPIEDPGLVDERRAQAHLMPMADYSCEIRQLYKATK